VNVLARHPIARVAALLVAVAVLSLACVSGAGARSVAKVPAGFVGVNVDGALTGTGLNGPVTGGTTAQPSLPGAMTTMVSTGVESVRAAFNWAAAQPTAGGAYDFAQSDAIVTAAAQRGLTVLPVVMYTPNWDARSDNPAGTIQIPRDTAPYAAYVSALVKRYGPKGTFWSANPSLPKRAIRMWQIWNEPNFTYYWPTRPFAPSYVALLKAAHTAVHRADPGAKVVLAGMPNDAWKYLAQIYKVKGAGKAFDIASVHPYTVKPPNVILFLQKMRQVMSRNGNGGKPLIVTEMGWNNSIGHRPSDTDCCQSTTARQAQKIKQILPLLAKDRKALKLQAFYYYTWASQGVVGGPSDTWAGLFQIRGSRLVAKPAYGAFKTSVLAIEHCKRIGKLAGTCKAR
jgi:arabinogalactan endo-1,4-beta-galactosidase